MLAVVCFAADKVDPKLRAQFDALLKQMDDEQWEVRERAAREVATLPGEVLPLVEAALASRDLSPEVRVQLSLHIEDFRRRGRFAARNRELDELATRYRDWVLQQYDKVGHHDPRWDRPARESLVQHIALTRGGPGPTARERTVAAQRKAIEAGCRDPLVRLYHLVDAQVSPVHGFDQYDQVVDGLLASQYAPRLKIVGLRVRSWARLRKLGHQRSDLEQDQALADLRAAIELFPAMKGDPQPTPSALLDLSTDLLDLAIDARLDPTGTGDALAKALSKASGEPADEQIIRAYVAERLAWKLERKRDEDARSQRQVHLEEAGRAAKAAWQLNPKSPLAALVNLNHAIALNDAQGVKRWYQAGIKLDVEHYGTRWAMLRYLTDHGDEAELLAFADDCFSTGGYHSGTAQLSINACTALLQRYDADSQAEMLARPELWDRVQAAYEGALAVAPHNSTFRSWYAFWACQANKWDIAHAQFQRLGDDVDPKPFAGKQMVDYYVRKAERLAGEKR